jgi:uncharacterized protein YjbI with pentapeptide repeats
MTYGATRTAATAAPRATAKCGGFSIKQATPRSNTKAASSRLCIAVWCHACVWSEPYLPELSKFRCPISADSEGALCVLHDPIPTKDRTRFWTVLAEKKQKGDFDFRGVVFPEDIRFEGELVGANFSWATFLGVANFHQAIFEGGTYFVETTFQQRANFGATLFKDIVAFWRTRFHEVANFMGATFDVEVTFFNSTFQADSLFEGALCHGPAVFRSTEFHGQSDFTHCTYRDDVDCSFATFSGDTTFLFAKFEGQVKFRGAKFQGFADFDYATFGSGPGFKAAYFLQTKFEIASSFSNTKFMGGGFFTQAHFGGPCRFQSTVFCSNTPRDISGHFKEARFLSNVYFEEDLVQGRLSFDRAEFAGALFIRGPFHPAPRRTPLGKRIGRRREIVVGSDEGESAFLEVFLQPLSPQLEFRNVLFEKPSEIHFERLDLGFSSFAGTSIRKIEFVDVVWPLAFWGRRHSGIPNRSQTGQSTSSLQDIWLRVGNQIRAVLARKTVADEFDVNTRPVNWDQARRACRDLRANLEEQRDYADAGDFYYSEMELRRRGLLREGIVVGSVGSCILHTGSCAAMAKDR